MSRPNSATLPATGGFSLYDGAKNIYRASVPVGTQSRQLFVDGVRAQRGTEST